MKRYSRTGRAFSVLLFDVDGLKSINDSHGHLVGSRALCRVAEILRLHCRELDVPARYGGHEFALILPEAALEAPCLVGGRIADGFTADTESPRISVSIGAAEYPKCGSTIEHLLRVADHALYDQKRQAAQQNLPEAPET